MRQFRYITCDVFTDRVFAGNPLAVLTDARGLDTDTMVAIAREFNYSETAFVTPPDDPRHTARLRIFTPRGELPFAGHPTIGAAYALASIGATPGASEVVFEEGVGPIRVRIERSGGQIVSCILTTAQQPTRGAAPMPARSPLAAMLGLTVRDLAAPPEVWSCGVPFLVVPLVSPEALARAQLDRARWSRLLAQHEGALVYPVARLDDASWQVRMFAPSLGVAEDAATGAAAAALCGWLISEAPEPQGVRRWRIVQGESVGRPSEIRLEADVIGGVTAAVRVGGRCVMIGEGVIRL